MSNSVRYTGLHSVYLLYENKKGLLFRFTCSRAIDTPTVAWCSEPESTLNSDFKIKVRNLKSLFKIRNQNVKFKIKIHNLHTRTH